MKNDNMIWQSRPHLGMNAWRGLPVRCKVLFAASLLLFACSDVADAAPIAINKLGTIDEFVVETNPIVFKGKPYLCEYIRYFSPTKRYSKNNLGCSYFRFLDMTDMKKVTPPCGKGLHMGNAFVDGNRVIITCVEDWGKSNFLQIESTDLVHWSEPRVILSGKGWAGYNTSVCKAGDRYVMAFELGKPRELVGRAFTVFFAESRDLKAWKEIKGAIYGKDFYTGSPMLRYFGGWFYLFYLESGVDGYRQRVARSRDLKDWKRSQSIVLDFDVNDKKIHPKATLNAAQLRKVETAENRNASDLDMCTYNGRVIFSYSWGDQKGCEFLAIGDAATTEQTFCESFFK